MNKEQILEEFKKKWCKTRGGGFLDLFCHIDDVAKALDKTQQATIEEIEKEFIHEFCNDHNKPEIRWLRGVAYDIDDLLKKILNFFDKLKKG